MFRSASNFEKLLDKATSNLRLEPDWPTILQLCDLIRQGDVQPKQALAHIKKKILNENPHVAYFGLLVLESCVKNCGSIIHDEIGTTTYMNQLREMLKTTTQEKLKNKILELIQAWAFAFRNSPKYRAVQDTMNILKAEDHKFPVLKESDAMFSADTAPEWADGDCCHRCRVLFSLMQRKHHCRACGQVFCGQCSSKQCTLPKFGIEKEVRVCDTCLANNSTKSTKSSSSPPTKSEDLPSEYINSSLAKQNQAPPPRKSEEELREEEELQLAIALSQSEAEHKQKLPSTRVKNYSSQHTTRTSSPPVEEVDPELARYLNRSYWENRPQSAPEEHQPPPHSSPSAPANFASMVNSHKVSNTSLPSALTGGTPTPAVSTTPTPTTLHHNGVESDAQLDEFVLALQDQVDVFINRMKSDYSRGRSICNDSTVQSSFMSITDAHSKLLRYIQQQDDSRVYYEGLQDKLAQVKDARAALNALREEHREKLRREAEMAEQQRQMQMAHKLEIMRKKKQEYLQYQRQVALQRIQEQEREMQMRQEQQKQQYMMGAANYNPIAYPPTIPGGYETPAVIPGGVNMVMNHPHANPGYPPAPVPAGYQFPVNDWRPNYMPPPNQPYMMQQGGMVMGGPPHAQQMGVRAPQGMGQPQTLPTGGQMGPQTTQGVPGQLQMQHQNLPQQGSMGPQSLPQQGGMGPQSLPQQGGMGPQSLPQQGSMGPQSLPQQGTLGQQQGTMVSQSLPQQGGIAPQNLPQQTTMGQSTMGGSHGILMSPKNQQGGTAPTQNGVGQGAQIMSGPQLMMTLHGMQNMPPVYQQQQVPQHMGQQQQQQIQATNPPHQSQQNQQLEIKHTAEPPETAELISFD